MFHGRSLSFECFYIRMACPFAPRKHIKSSRNTQTEVSKVEPWVARPNVALAFPPIVHWFFESYEPCHARRKEASRRLGVPKLGQRAVHDFSYQGFLSGFEGDLPRARRTNEHFSFWSFFGTVTWCRCCVWGDGDWIFEKSRIRGIFMHESTIIGKMGPPAVLIMCSSTDTNAWKKGRFTLLTCPYSRIARGHCGHHLFNKK